MTAEVMDNPPVGAGSARVDLSAPTTLADTGLSEDLITQLVIKLLHFNANCTGVEIAHRVGLEFAVVESILETLKRSHQCEVVGGGLLGAPSFRYRITDHGRQRAQLFLEHNQYVGAAPVPLSQYREYMTKFQQATRRIVTPAAVRQAVSHLVLSDRVVNQIGPAVTSGQSLFVYGPPGNGKTVIAQALHNLLEGPIAIPHALEVEGQIIRLFNPINHEPIPDDGADPWTTEARLDRRWVLCRRPKVMVGGELTMQSLDLAYSATTGFYNAPIQLMANGGLLVIDDFGRQSVLAARNAEPVDRPTRVARGLSHAPERAEVRGTVRRAGGVRDQYQADRTRRRGIPPADSATRCSRRARRSRSSARSSRAAVASADSPYDAALVERSAERLLSGSRRLRCAAVIRAT